MQIILKTLLMESTITEERIEIAPPSTISMNINGFETLLQVRPWVSLLDALRDHAHLTGAKKGCDHGQCGACTVICNGKRIYSCMTLAVMQEGSEITTIEGISQGSKLHAIQEAFIEHDGFQCG